MNIFSKLKETVISVFPIMAVVLFLGTVVVPLEKDLIIKFIFGGVFLIIGLTLFLVGVDVGIQAIGERVGAELTSKKNIILLLTVAFAIGFIVTVAEPDIQVFANQITSIYKNANKLYLIICIALGVAFFIAIGLCRVVFRINLKILLFICYLALFSLTIFCPREFIGIAFDSGGATTGPMTVPFILALGIGVSSVFKNNGKNNSFGLTGVTSVGPVMSVLIYGIILSFCGEIELNTESGTEDFLDKGVLVFFKMFPHYLKEGFYSILPLVLMFLLFQLFLLKMPPYQVIKISFGLLWSLLGLSIFLTGVNCGFIPLGNSLGVQLGLKSISNGFIWKVILICTGLIFGAIVVCAEPAVWVLTEQVESISGGAIKRKLMLIFLSIGASFAIGIAILRAIYGFNLLYIIVPGYLIAFLLMIFCPNLFTGIAFDSGGVASGPITSTFVLSFTLGTAKACGNSSDVFGVISLVAMMPLIAIQLLGIIYNKKTNQKLKKAN